MSDYLLLRDIRVENANAISGMTYGFPSPSNFLGYSHALSRSLQKKYGATVSLGGVGIICHQHQVQAHRIGYETVFALTRNPITHEGKTAPFNEEGRMHLTVSLLIECNFDVTDLAINPDADINLNEETPAQRQRSFINCVHEQAVNQRLAGGTITNIGNVNILSIDNNSEAGEREFRRWMLRLIPGFVLKDRHDALCNHHQARLIENTEAELLDSWLDFIALDSEAVLADNFEGEPVEGETTATWRFKPKPEAGYFVPLAVGFEAISPLYEAGVVERARDNQVPFRFVESTYSIGQWLGPHRIKTPKDMLWHYHHEEDEQGGRYICRGKTTQPAAPIIDLNDNTFYDDDY